MSTKVFVGRCTGRRPGRPAGTTRSSGHSRRDGRHLLVKFAARGSTEDVVTRRWCDLLLLEALALQVVSAHGIPAAHTSIVETAPYWFLESVRFDRAGVRGRIAVVSLAAAHDDPADSWARAAAVLSAAGRLSDEDAHRLRWLDAFGALLGNTDRHQYNILFFLDDPQLRLAPAFDQAPILYAPAADGQVLSRTFRLPPATSDTLGTWDDARAAARQFWEMGSDDARLTDEMRSVCTANATLCAASVPWG